MMKACQMAEARPVVETSRAMFGDAPARRPVQALEGRSRSGHRRLGRARSPVLNGHAESDPPGQAPVRLADSGACYTQGTTKEEEVGLNMPTIDSSIEDNR
jgi:hypothetical protein